MTSRNLNTLIFRLENYFSKIFLCFWAGRYCCFRAGQGLYFLLTAVPESNSIQVQHAVNLTCIETGFFTDGICINIAELTEEQIRAKIASYLLSQLSIPSAESSYILPN